MLGRQSKHCKVTLCFASSFVWDHYFYVFGGLLLFIFLMGALVILWGIREEEEERAR